MDNQYSLESRNSHDDSTVGFDLVLASLQPLQDLAKNWDIDVSSCLEEYLQELSEISPEAINRFQRINENGSLNFSQAALVVQNSSHVYGRKVDFLYKLVYKHLEDLATELSRQSLGDKASNKRNKHSDAEIDEFLNFDPYQDFLPLDNVLPTVDRTNNRKKNPIDIAQEDHDCTNVVDLFNRRSSLPSISRTRLSLGSLNAKTCSLDTTFDRTGLEGTTVAQNRALISTMDSNNCLRLSSGGCDIGENGILVIPGASIADPHAYNIKENVWQESESVTNSNLRLDFCTADYDDQEDGHSFHMVDDTGGLEHSAEKPTKKVTFDSSSEYTQNHQTSILGSDEINKIRDDGWVLHDPHKQDKFRSRPLRIGKSVILPEELSHLPSECVNGSSTKRRLDKLGKSAPNLQPTRLSIAAESFKASIKRSGMSSSNIEEDGSLNHLLLVQQKRLIFGNEFAYIAKIIEKRKASERREKIRQLKQCGKVDEVYATHMSYTNFADDDEDADGYFMNEDYGLDEEGKINEEKRGATFTNTGVTSINDVFQTGEESDEDLHVSRGLTFAELCRAHIENFARGAEKYAVETQLTQRVDMWQSRLKPVLDDEENRPPFDIHLYGSSFIENLESRIKQQANTSTSDKWSEIDFRILTANQPTYEVCRLFLASLSLCNSQNISFTNAECRSTPSSILNVKLVKSEIEKPMETYLLPNLGLNDYE